MVIAFRKPLTVETQKTFDDIDLTGTKQTVIACSLCKTEYVLIHPEDLEEATLKEYVRGVKMGMQNCKTHPPSFPLNF